MTDQTKRKCTGCRVIKLEFDFGIKKYDIMYKTCKTCRENSIKQRSKIDNNIGKYNCIHNRLKYQCKECNGNKICEHNTREYYC